MRRMLISRAILAHFMGQAPFIMSNSKVNGPMDKDRRVVSHQAERVSFRSLECVNLRTAFYTSRRKG